MAIKTNGARINLALNCLMGCKKLKESPIKLITYYIIGRPGERPSNNLAQRMLV